MKSNTSYIIVTGTISKLEKRVSEKMKEGYKPKRGLTGFGKNHIGMKIFAQAMVKDAS